MKTAACDDDLIVRAVSFDPMRSDQLSMNDHLVREFRMLDADAKTAGFADPCFAVYVSNLKASKYEIPTLVPPANLVFGRLVTNGHEGMTAAIADAAGSVLGLGINGGRVATVYLVAYRA